MGAAQGPDQRGIGLRRVSVAREDVGLSASRLHPPGKGQPHLVWLNQIGHSPFPGMKFFNDPANKVERQKQIDMLCMDLEATYKRERVLL